MDITSLGQPWTVEGEGGAYRFTDHVGRPLEPSMMTLASRAPELLLALRNLLSDLHEGRPINPSPGWSALRSAGYKPIRAAKPRAYVEDHHDTDGHSRSWVHDLHPNDPTRLKELGGWPRREFE